MAHFGILPVPCRSHFKSILAILCVLKFSFALISFEGEVAGPAKVIAPERNVCSLHCRRCDVNAVKKTLQNALVLYKTAQIPRVRTSRSPATFGKTGQCWPKSCQGTPALGHEASQSVVSLLLLLLGPQTALTSPQHLAVPVLMFNAMKA